MKFVTERIDKRIQSNRREIELAEDEEKILQLMKQNNELEEEKKKIRAEMS
jgi:single-stranded DNA-specific DHH superfamily exonuclease